MKKRGFFKKQFIRRICDGNGSRWTGTEALSIVKKMGTRVRRVVLWANHAVVFVVETLFARGGTSLALQSSVIGKMLSRAGGHAGICRTEEKPCQARVTEGRTVTGLAGKRALHTNIRYD